MRIVRAGHDRERSPDHAIVRVVEAEPRIVSRREAKTRCPAAAKGQQAGRPVAQREDGLGRKTRGGRQRGRLPMVRLRERGRRGLPDRSKRAGIDRSLDDGAPRTPRGSAAPRVIAHPAQHSSAWRSWGGISRTSSWFWTISVVVMVGLLGGAASLLPSRR
jgi:hypothetical protein